MHHTFIPIYISTKMQFDLIVTFLLQQITALPSNLLKKIRKEAGNLTL